MNVDLFSILDGYSIDSDCGTDDMRASSDTGLGDRTIILHMDWFNHTLINVFHYCVLVINGSISNKNIMKKL